MSTPILRPVIIGTEGCGKTSLLNQIAGKEVSQYEPTTFDYVTVDMTVNKTIVTICMGDTAGNFAQKFLRSLVFTVATTDVILLCLAVDDRSSFEAIEDIWKPEAEEFAGGIPIILIGNKVDTRQHQTFVTTEEANALAERIGAIQYVECSAITGTGIKPLIDAIVSTYPTKTRVHGKNMGCCSIM